MKKQNIGLIGLGPMGQNLVLNIESKGYKVAVFNRTSTKTEKFAEETAKGKNILPTYSLEEFVNSLETPRKMILLVKQGKPVVNFINPKGRIPRACPWMNGVRLAWIIAWQ